MTSTSPQTSSPASPSGPEVVVSGARPTGQLHLGNLHGALQVWRSLQSEHRCLFFVADWHALTTDYADVRDLQASVREMVRDWLAIGLDPERVTIFQQSLVKEHAELQLIFSMITPVPWLERNPVYKEQREQLNDRDLSTLGFLGYPVLQAADILVYKGTHVPVGIDQVPHIELTREIARRFNQLYGAVFPEPQSLLAETPKIPGLDGRKMSKSYNNTVLLSDSPEDVDRKLSRMATDPRRVRRHDAGDPKDCPAFILHRVYSTPEELEYVTNGCRTAGIGCLDCKKIMIKHVLAELAPIRERRAQLTTHDVDAVINAGTETARGIARSTMNEVRAAVGLSGTPGEVG
jgi:tryptophanyl-tRNA synthetase